MSSNLGAEKCAKRAPSGFASLRPQKSPTTPTTYPPPEHNHFHVSFILPPPACHAYAGVTVEEIGR
jgi:hypothetical protein